ncbi:glycosyltransferase [Hanstruepera marina]|uniref:glycosyltransferase n=1 Tax=Hanstruepera marina TaxID=2873265 RepID=UPI001CA76FBA|nr:glycosyltransferase [Hanstruepera marina]
MTTTCIIVPCYNEENRIDSTAFKNYSTTLDFLFINDGSNDNTQQILDELADYADNFKVLHLKKNVGKAEAIRQGVLSTSKEYNFIGYLDADLSTPLNEIERLNKIAIESQKSIVMGSRVKLIGTKIERRLKRHLSGRIIATCIDTFLLQLGIYDTQCGAKIIQSSLANVIFKDPFKTKWLFDVELILRTKLNFGKNYCLQNIMEVPLLTWTDVGASKITLIDILNLPFNFLKIYGHYK